MTRSGMFCLCCAGATLFTLLVPVSPARADGPKLSYNRDVRPILSENCFFCHGPDKNKRQSKLRLDVRDAALTGGKSGEPAVVPGKPAESELVKRIRLPAADDELMPPAESHKKLTDAQKQTLANWVAQGAAYEPHWAYIPPTRPPVPAVKAANWPRTPIDAFVLQALEARNLAPSREADRRTLLRRLSLDLIGLPPTPAEVDAFVRDASPDAYEKQVDRLLASPHYGERMAVPWLDAVRFADTVGFHGDQNQNVFPYRDYVIDAFNHNKPFDQFTIEQLAGDLLPNPTTEQLVATGFNRLNMVTREGGAQPKEYLVKYAADRVRTASAAWLGSTMGCCECHDHKYDPFSAKDFYSFGAFWADVKQWGVYADYTYTPNPDLRGVNNDYPFPPEITVDSPYLQQRIARLEQQAGQAIAAAAPAFHASPAFAKWSAATASFLKQHPDGWQVLATRAAAAPTPKDQAPGPDGSILFLGKPGDVDHVELALPPGRVAAIRLEAIPVAEHGHGLHRPPAAKPDGKVDPKVAKAEAKALVTLAASIKPKAGREAKLAFAFADADVKDERYANGYAVLGIKGGWKTAAGHDGQTQTAVYELDAPRVAAAGDVLVIDLPKNTLGCVRVSVSPVAAPKPIDPAFVTSLATALAGSGNDTSPVIDLAYVLAANDASQAATLAEVRRLRQAVAECRDGRSPTVVTQAWQPRVSRILGRGNWQDESGEVVTPHVPHFLPQPPEPPAGQRLTRLDLAKWIVSADNPLTARTIVNRLWKQFYGNGLSAQVEDLGGQGEWPSHPELLDWLAVEFQGGWDVKHIVRLMVTSAAYRQDSNLRPELKDVDPANRLLASQNPRRLEAEFVRDNALAAAGLLNLDLGGPSAHPYQPAGYYANIQFPSRDYVAEADERQYRRGLYMHWQRTFLHPMLANFDAPSREDSVCSRNISNTPQQALTLLNDPEYVEAARTLAAVAIAAGGDDAAQLELVYQRAVSRSPKANERASLMTFLAAQRGYYAANPAEAEKLLHVGLAPAADLAAAPEQAAWANVCRVVLNLHETITRY